MALRGRCWAVALLLATLAGGAGCAARVPGATAAPAQTTRARDVSALIERGCYRCLEHAYREVVEADADQVRLAPQVFEAALLLAARSKELGLPYEPWLERARAVIPAGPDWSDYLAIVQAFASIH
jgi:hypothetical protein